MHPHLSGLTAYASYSFAFVSQVIHKCTLPTTACHTLIEDISSTKETKVFGCDNI